MTNRASSPDLNLDRHTRTSAFSVRQTRKIRDLFTSTLSHGLIIFVGMFFAIPFLWMLLTAFKSDRDVFHTPPRWLPHDNVRVDINGEEYPLYNVKTSDGVKQYAALKIESGVAFFVDPADPDVVIPTELQQGTERVAQAIEEVSFRWQNFPDAMNRGSRPGVGASFWVYFRNSLVIAFFTIVGTLVSNTPVAYAFARLKFPGRDVLFVIILATMMLPFQVTMIPIYLLFNDTLGWGDTFLPLIIPTFFANAWDVFLLRQFFKTIPEEMCDAARVDGASEWQIFTQIVLPLSTPVLATVTVFTFLWAWNDFTGPLLFLNSPRNFTMALGLQDFQGQNTIIWNQLMAAATVFTLPIIVAFFFAQKTFIQGIKLTGSKE
ncbi:MAG: carbohydrate ABC transporter permease [Anaerolineales bacterium]|nr:MAG: carbohydrate ABC transporter permease [Chloroflexota bacterium]MBE7434612.1 carbohydrate ABC transporter permease [Anaerolineales bacterium]MCE7859384.1 carbohydrate ABC transporter permease [Chloroflexi bacterium CFX2]MCK6583918.1 carbohydrate ABC transporter permease [Anaerolineales bacterium]